MTDIKSGWKTTEFWLTLVSVLCGALLAAGVFPLESSWGKVVGVLAAVLASLGYGVARARVKAPPTSVLLLLSATLLVSGCSSSWQEISRKSLYSAHTIGVSASIEAERVCRPALERCKEERRNPCPKLLQCQLKRRPVLQVLETLQRTVLIGLMAVEVGDQWGASKVVTAGIKAVTQIRGILTTWGVTL